MMTRQQEMRKQKEEAMERACEKAERGRWRRTLLLWQRQSQRDEWRR